MSSANSHDNHHHSHSHPHGAGHSHAHPPMARGSVSGAFKVAMALNLAYVAAQVLFGLLSHSLALLADAAHNFGDVLGLALAWGAGVLSRRSPTRRHTYGFGASSTLAALANAILLLITVGGISWEALRRLAQPQMPAADVVIWVAAVGILVNGGSALLFMRGQREDLNVRAAFLHLAADAGITAGVVAAGLGMEFTGWSWLDPATSLVIGAVITAGTWGLLRQSIDLALDAVPHGIDIDAIETYLAGLPGVTQVHDLHIWAMSTSDTALTAHLVRPGEPIDDALVAHASHVLEERFGIRHATFQFEHDPAACRLADPNVV